MSDPSIVKKVRTKKVVSRKKKEEGGEEEAKMAKRREQVEKRVQLDKRIFHLQQLLIDTNVTQALMREAVWSFTYNMHL